MDGAERLRRVAAAAQAARSSLQLHASRSFTQLADDAPPVVNAMVARVAGGGEGVNLVVSFLRWRRRLPPLLGHEHVISYPILPLGERLGLLVGVADIGGRVGVGVTTDPAIVPEARFLATAFQDAATELAAVSSGGRREGGRRS
jgi:hypothetical protein